MVLLTAVIYYSSGTQQDQQGERSMEGSPRNPGTGFARSSVGSGFQSHVELRPPFMSCNTAFNLPVPNKLHDPCGFKGIRVDSTY